MPMPKAPPFSESDHDYRIINDATTVSPLAICCRNAALWPLIRHRKEPEAPDVVTAYRRLTTKWRHRLLELDNAGWQFAVNDSDKYHDAHGYALACLRNCPPFCANTHPKQRFKNVCKKWRVCPWCYARLVVGEAYSSIETALFPYDIEHALGGMQLVTVRCGGVTTLKSDVSVWLQTAAKRRFDDADCLPSKTVWGSFSCFTTSPVVLKPSENPDFMRLSWRRTTLLLTFQGAKLEPLSQQAGRPRKIRILAGDDLTRWNMANAIGQALAYPYGMLFGPAEDAARILNALVALKPIRPKKNAKDPDVLGVGKVRWFRTTGILRNAEHRKFYDAFRRHGAPAEIFPKPADVMGPLDTFAVPRENNVADYSHPDDLGCVLPDADRYHEMAPDETPAVDDPEDPEACAVSARGYANLVAAADRLAKKEKSDASTQTP